MRRFYHRVGPWILLFTFAWYVAGTYWLRQLNDKRWDIVRSRHVAVQDLDIGSTQMVRIRPHARGLDEVKFIFDATLAKLRIENPNIELAVDSQIRDGVVELLLEPSVPDYSGYNRITVRLPLSVERIVVEDTWRSVAIAADTAVSLAELTLVLRDFLGQMTMEHIKIQKLNLEQVDVPEPKKRAPSIALNEGTTIDELRVAMSGGTFEFDATAPRQSWFRVNDSVQITGKRPFLESIRFIPGE